MELSYIRMLVEIFRTVDFLKVIAITGGPCGGKSTFLKMAIKLLLDCGFKVIVVPEVARELIAAGIVPWDPSWKSSKSFQKHILLCVLQKEALYLEAIKDQDLKGQKVVFLCDRGTADGAAYCGIEIFEEVLKELGLTFADVLDRYDAVIHLVTAAIGALDYYVMDDERHETPEEAAELDILTRKAWHLHRHFTLIDNSTSFAEKILKAISALRRILPMPTTPLEIESKFLLTNFTSDMIPEGTESYDIVQTYLDRDDRPGIECRVRKKTTRGTSKWFYTEKIDTEEHGQRAETPDQPLSEEEYLGLIQKFNNLAWDPIVKTRYKIPEGEFMIELDVFGGNLEGRATAEVEFKSGEELAAFVFPDRFGPWVDVTANKAHSNASLAKHGLPATV
jgi:CYTH domain-containing protein/predicted ATPase